MPPRDSRDGPRGRGRRPAGGATKGAPKGASPASGDIARLIEAPASAVYSLLTDATRRGWAPVPVMRVVSALAPRFVRLALPDGTMVAIAIARQGNARCSVTVEVTVLPAGVDGAAVRATWRGALAAMAEQLDHDWG